MLHYTTPNGIGYDYSLSVNGGHFILFAKDRNETDKKIAKEWLRNNQDVVSLRFANESDYQYLFKGDVYRDPRTKPLKWYQINEDAIPQQYNKITPTEYVEKYVLPFIEETEKRLFAKHGDKIYSN